MELTLKNVVHLSDDMRTPSSMRAAVTDGIVHIGLGNFHHAHQACHPHRLMDQELTLDWAIVSRWSDGPHFAKRFVHWLTLVWDQGIEAALQSYLES